MDKNKKHLIILIVVAALVVSVTIGVTYAYFASGFSEEALKNISIYTTNTDDIVFSTGDAINIVISQDNFTQGSGNQSGTTTATATFTAASTNTETTKYYLYLDLTGNPFTYTTDVETPELLLKIVDPSGNEINTSLLDGLSYVTVTDDDNNTLTGYDITEIGRVVTIANGYEITSSNGNEVKQDWEINVTFVNLSTSQAANANKTLTARLIIRNEQL